MLAGDRIMILKQEMLQNLHVAHQGMQRTKALAKKHFYWPGMMRDIKQIVEACSACQQFHLRNQREPLILRDILELPWLRAPVGADIFDINVQSYLLIVDYFSKYLEVRVKSGN